MFKLLRQENTDGGKPSHQVQTTTSPVAVAILTASQVRTRREFCHPDARSKNYGFGDSGKRILALLVMGDG